MYTLFGATAGSHDLTVVAQDTVPCPRAVGLQIDGTLAGVDFVLPPEQDAMINGGWETGDLTGWQAAPAAAATVEASAVHTGRGWAAPGLARDCQLGARTAALADLTDHHPAGRHL